MRNLVLFMHVSLDGFVGGTNGEMDWIKVDEEVFDLSGRRTDAADTALYGRKTYEMTQAYWPTAADQPNATRHDIQHSKWYQTVAKVVVSKTLHGTDLANTTIVGDHLTDEIIKLKQAPGKEIVIFGSPGVAHSLMAARLIDDYWLLINPVLIGQGIPLFSKIEDRTTLGLVSTKPLSSGVVCLHYRLLPKDI